MMSIVLTGHGGSFNKGCEAIVRGTIDIIQTTSTRLYYNLNISRSTIG